jgi:hypothetical protein
MDCIYWFLKRIFEKKISLKGLGNLISIYKCVQNSYEFVNLDQFIVRERQSPNRIIVIRTIDHNTSLFKLVFLLTILEHLMVWFLI